MWTTEKQVHGSNCFRRESRLKIQRGFFTTGCGRLELGADSVALLGLCPLPLTLVGSVSDKYSRSEAVPLLGPGLCGWWLPRLVSCGACSGGLLTAVSEPSWLEPMEPPVTAASANIGLQLLETQVRTD